MDEGIRNSKLLIMVPCYNEKENVGKLGEALLALGTGADILFVDDNSPDGTGKIINELSEKYGNVKAVHRAGKLGIGSAHKDGIKWAYDNGYDTLITMDCDFTHSPEDVRLFLAHSKDHDIVIGSRYMQKDSLKGWNIMRKTLTSLGHIATAFFLKMPHDATGAFRLYDLTKIPLQAFKLVESNGYSFFFESLYVLKLNKFSIKEFPIKLPPRTYGSSKMKVSDALQSLRFLGSIYWKTLTNKSRFMIPKTGSYNENECQEDWDAYWNEQKNSAGGFLYDTIAAFYRKFIIRRILNYFVKKYFKPKSQILHAGCGSGQVDEDIRDIINITGLDISPNALKVNEKVNQGKCKLVLGDIFALPFPDKEMDGIYNLGVMEHFTEEDIGKILAEFRRTLKDDGRLIIFWPPEFGLSVMFLKAVKFFLEKILRRKNVKIHPDEISRIKSKKYAVDIFSRSGFKVLKYYFGPKDLFTYAVIVAEKNSN
jgi:dolichol-phosphate mannosyltransferase